MKRLNFTPTQFDALAGLRQEFTCSACKAIFEDPHTLPCSHVFCAECIFDHLTTANECPTCRLPTAPRDVSKLRSMSNLCEDMDEIVELLDELKRIDEYDNLVLQQSNQQEDSSSKQTNQGVRGTSSQADASLRPKVVEKAVNTSPGLKLHSVSGSQAASIADKENQYGDREIASDSQGESTNVGGRLQESQGNPNNSEPLEEETQVDDGALDAENSESLDVGACEKMIGKHGESLSLEFGNSLPDIGSLDESAGLVDSQDIAAMTGQLSSNLNAAKELVLCNSAPSSDGVHYPSSQSLIAEDKACNSIIDKPNSNALVLDDDKNAASSHDVPRMPQKDHGVAEVNMNIAANSASSKNKLALSTSSAVSSSRIHGPGLSDSLKAVEEIEDTPRASSASFSGPQPQPSPLLSESAPKDSAAAPISSRGTKRKHSQREQRRRLRSRAGGPFIVCTMLKHKEYELVHTTVCEVNAAGSQRAQIQSKIDSLTTHLVAHTGDGKRRCPRSMKYFRAVAMGIIVVSFDWVLACRDAGTWLPIEPFEVEGGENDKRLPSQGPMRSRLAHAHPNFAQPGGPQRLFHGLTIAFHGDFTKVRLKVWQLKQLVMILGGKVAPLDRTNRKREWLQNHSPSSRSLGGTTFTAESSLTFIICPKNLDPHIVSNVAQSTGVELVSHCWLCSSISSYSRLEWNDSKYRMRREAKSGVRSSMRIRSRKGKQHSQPKNSTDHQTKVAAKISP